MKLLQLNKINEESIKTLRDSFNNLPETSHLDGKFRLRKFSRVELRTSFWNAGTELNLERLAHADFIQSEEFNKYQGDVARDFEEIEDEALFSVGMKHALLTFKEANDLCDGHEVEIHQMRIITGDDGVGLTCPEGPHQDGFRNLAVLGVNRFNIIEGKFQVMESRDEEPFLEKTLNDGEMAMLRDDVLWHCATSVVAADKSKRGYWDAFVFCAKSL